VAQVWPILSRIRYKSITSVKVQELRPFQLTRCVIRNFAIPDELLVGGNLTIRDVKTTIFTVLRNVRNHRNLSRPIKCTS
jgi:hypothetical protein